MACTRCGGPQRTGSLLRGNYVIRRHDQLKGTYLMIDDWWGLVTPMVGAWSSVDEIRDFVVIARDVDPRTPEGAVLKLCGYKKDKTGNVVPIK